MLRAALFALSLAFATGSAAQSGAPSVPAQAKPPAKAQAKKPARGQPAWAQLTADQQQILAPLKADWDSLETDRKRKWIGIAKRYPTMKPKAQERVQKRMQAWASLTPEQRRQARENYRRIAKERQEKRKLREQWAEYQALTPDERMRLDPPPEAAPSPGPSR